MRSCCLAVVIVLRRVGGNAVVDGLVKVQSNKTAAHHVWGIATSLLYAIAIALIAYGLVVALAAWFAGPTRPARFLRRSLAPVLRDQPATVYALVGGVLLLVIAWGPTPAFRELIPILIFAGLLALAVHVLRRQTAREFPAAERMSDR